MSRLAIVLAGLLLSLFAASTASAARSEFFGIVQIATLDNQDMQDMQEARVRTNRFLFKWGWVQPVNGSSYEWDPPDQFIGRLAFHGIRVVPSVWGNPAWVAGSASTPPLGGAVAENAWRNFLKALVARYGPGGNYWTTELPPAVPGRHAAADPVLAGLERAQSAEVLRAEPLARQVRPPGPDLTRRDQEQGSQRQGRAGGNDRQRGHRGLGASSTASTRWPGSRTSSTPPPCIRTRPPSTACGS